MSSTYSPSLKFELIGSGDQSGNWGNTTNNNLGVLVEQAITGVQYITMANANYVLSNYNGTSDEARCAVIVAQGTNGAVYQVICPQQPKLYVISNQTTGGYSITIGAPTGSVVTIPPGVTAQIYCDGTNTFSSQTGSAGNFVVNGTLTAAGEVDTGAMSIGTTLTVGGVTTLNGALQVNNTLNVTGQTNLANTFIGGTGTTATQTAGTNNTTIATTAFVTGAVNTLAAGTVQTARQITNAGGWNVTPSGTKIYFNYNGTNVASIDSSGNLIVLGNV